MTVFTFVRDVAAVIGFVVVAGVVYGASYFVTLEWSDHRRAKRRELYRACDE